MLSVEFSSNQMLELFVVLCVADKCRYVFSRCGSAFAHARSKGGLVRPDSMPTRFSALICYTQGLANFLIPTTYALSVAGARFRQPQWMNALALPDVVYGTQLNGLPKNTVRVAGCMANFALQSVADLTFKHLDDQYHPIGRRENSRIVQTGPYAWVRHPLYALSLLQTAIWSTMFWSYTPLFALIATVPILAVKIRMEEEAILRDEAVKEEYLAYMRKVRARVIPYVW